jgi:hypothetical protein
VVAFDPAANRIFVRFRDAGGVLRGTAVPGDNHPNAAIHALWGQALAEHLRRF